MMTSYLVRCPHSGCRYFGSIQPASRVETPHGAIPARPQVLFKCPKCQTQWKALLVGEDVKPLPLDKGLA